MGLLRWLLWPRRQKKHEDEEEPEERPHRKRHAADQGVYRIEVDQEARRFRGEGPPFSFWSSSRIILILALLLWWIQPAGPMIAGFVGGRRAGSPWKAIVSALLPVFAILVVNFSYTHSVAARQIDFVASLPAVVGDGVASLLPFLAPYKDFMIAYLDGFVAALGATFGMGTNGYLMVVVFAYIGGLIAEQTRRELHYRGSGTSVGVNLVQPLFHPRSRGDEDVEFEDEALEDGHRPTRAAVRAHGPSARRRRRHGSPDRLEELRKIPAEAYETHGSRRTTRARQAAKEAAEDEDDEDEEDARSSRVHRPVKAAALPHGHEPEEAEEHVAEPPRREVRERRPAKARSREEEIAIQRFVERALRNYDHSRL